MLWEDMVAEFDGGFERVANPAYVLARIIIVSENAQNGISPGFFFVQACKLKSFGQPCVGLRLSFQMFLNRLLDTASLKCLHQSKVKTGFLLLTVVGRLICVPSISDEAVYNFRGSSHWTSLDGFISQGLWPSKPVCWWQSYRLYAPRNVMVGIQETMRQRSTEFSWGMWIFECRDTHHCNPISRPNHCNPPHSKKI